VTDRLFIVMIADVPADGVAAFQEYESRVLPLLDRHDGRLERRFRGGDGEVEVHVVSFGSRRGFESYMDDPDRRAHRELLDGVDLTQRVLELTEVER